MKLLAIQKLLSSLSSKNKRILSLCGIYFLSIEILFLSFSFVEDKTIDANVKIETRFDQLITSIDSLERLAISNKPLSQKQSCYALARKNYKHIEAVIEYVAPFYAKYFINGPPIKKHDIENGNKVFEPHGFQLLESALFSNDTSLSKEEMIYEIKLLKETIIQTKKIYKSVVPRNSQYFDMIQLELIRIITLNINGYDCSITKENIVETSYVLDGISELLVGIKGIEARNTSVSAFKKIIVDSKSYLFQNNNYNTFNRLNFIVTYIKPLYELIYNIRHELKLDATPVNYAVNFEEKDLFGKLFFNKNYFSVNISDSLLVREQIELGKNLFFDPVLSSNNKRACASCHKPQFGFADTVAKNLDYTRIGFLKRNTPSLLNVMHQKNFFYDGRSLQLEDQASDVLHAKNEMNSNPADIVNKLKQSDDYKNLFRNAFKGRPDTAITFYGILKSLSEFEKTLISTNSRFDKYIQGDKKALSKNEIAGYTVFAGKALCASCHFFPLFNGLVPPAYNDNEFEVIGTPKNSNSKQIDSDSGRVLITKKHIHLYSFKTPGIRNLEATFPYMHNGVFKSLDGVIDFYNKGGGSVDNNSALTNQTLPFDSLQLSIQEKADIKSFLMSLSDNQYKYITPKKLPKFKDPAIDKRKIGGEY